MSFSVNNTSTKTATATTTAAAALSNTAKIVNSNNNSSSSNAALASSQPSSAAASSSSSSSSSHTATAGAGLQKSSAPSSAATAAAVSNVNNTNNNNLAAAAAKQAYSSNPSADSHKENHQYQQQHHGHPNSQHYQGARQPPYYNNNNKNHSSAAAAAAANTAAAIVNGAGVLANPANYQNNLNQNHIHSNSNEPGANLRSDMSHPHYRNQQASYAPSNPQAQGFNPQPHPRHNQNNQNQNQYNQQQPQQPPQQQQVLHAQQQQAPQQQAPQQPSQQQQQQPSGPINQSQQQPQQQQQALARMPGGGAQSQQNAQTAQQPGAYLAQQVASDVQQQQQQQQQQQNANYMMRNAPQPGMQYEFALPMGYATNNGMVGQSQGRYAIPNLYQAANPNAQQFYAINAAAAANQYVMQAHNPAQGQFVPYDIYQQYPPSAYGMAPPPQWNPMNQPPPNQALPGVVNRYQQQQQQQQQANEGNPGAVAVNPNNVPVQAPHLPPQAAPNAPHAPAHGGAGVQVAQAQAQQQLAAPAPLAQMNMAPHSAATVPGGNMYANPAIVQVAPVPTTGPYNQGPQLVAPALQASMAVPIQVAPAVPYTKRERKPLLIVDPVSRQPVVDPKKDDKEKENLSKSQTQPSISSTTTTAAAAVSSAPPQQTSIPASSSANQPLSKTATTADSTTTATPTTTTPAQTTPAPAAEQQTGNKHSKPDASSSAASDFQKQVLKNIQGNGTQAPAPAEVKPPVAAVQPTPAQKAAPAVAKTTQPAAQVTAPAPVTAPVNNVVAEKVSEPKPVEPVAAPAVAPAPAAPPVFSYASAAAKNPPKTAIQTRPPNAQQPAQSTPGAGGAPNSQGQGPARQQQQPQTPQSGAPPASRPSSDNNNNKAKQPDQQQQPQSGSASLRIKPTNKENAPDLAGGANHQNKLQISTKDSSGKGVAAPVAKPVDVPVPSSSAPPPQQQQSVSVAPPVTATVPVEAQQPTAKSAQPAATSEPPKATEVAAEPKKAAPAPAAPAQATSTTAPVPAAEQKPVVREPEQPTAPPAQARTVSSSEPAAEPKSAPAVAAEPAAKATGALNFWTPENKDAKKRYDRDFLMSLSQKKLSLKIPEGLASLEVFVSAENQNMTRSGSMHQHEYMGKHSYGGSNDNYFNKGSTNNKRKGGPNKNMSNSPQQPVTHIVLNRDPDLALKRAENPYVVKTRVASLDENEELLRQVRNILNKLTPQNINKLTTDLIKLPINSEDRLRGSIEIIFEKSIDEPVFSQTYAQLCNVLAQIKVPQATDPTKYTSFRTMLLTKCQKAFDTDYNKEVNYDELLQEAENCTDEAKKKELKEIAEEKLLKAKRKSLGNIRFIGELFKLNMLTESIMFDCIERLLKQESDEENIECLCRLLTTIGKELDKQTNQVKMKSAFERLDKITKKKDIVSARIRFMILDVIDLRRGDWVPRRKDAAPKKIDEIRREAAEEQIRKEAEIAASQANDRRSGMQGGKGMGGGRGSGGGSSGGGLKSSSMDNESYRGKLSNNGAGNMVNKLKEVKQNITNTQMNPQFTLGPSWNKGPVKTSSTDASSSSGSGSSNMPSSASFSTGAGGSFNKNQSHDDYDKRNMGPGGQKTNSRYQNDMTARLSMDSNKNFKESQQVNKVKKMDGSSSTLPRSETSSQASSRETSMSRPSRDNSRTRNSDATGELSSNDKLSGDSSQRRSYSSDEIDRKVELTVDEYIQNKDISEALKDIDEFRPTDPKQYAEFVEAMITKVLERSESVRNSVGQILFHAIREKKLETRWFVSGFKSIISMADEMVIDIPKIATYLSQIISPFVAVDSTLDFLSSACEPIKGMPVCADFLSELLHNASNRLGHHTVAEIFRASNLRLSDFVSNPAEFVVEKNLEWIQRTRERTQSASVSSDSYERRLLEILADPSAENEKIFDKIENEYADSDCTSRAFIRALVTVVCRSCMNEAKIDPIVFKKRSAILTKFIDRKEDLELEALFAVQALDHKTQHQPGFIRVIFDLLYDEDIIREDVYWRWKNDMREEGHAISVLALKAFFEWLNEADGENEHPN